jgi:N-acetylornithine carbamoyltransferase
MDGGRTEHVRDAVGKFLSGVADLLGVRCFADPGRPYEEAATDPVLRAVERAAEVPVINLESALFHPMQGLADLFTLRHRLPGDPADHTVALTWAYHPRALPMAVAHTALLGFCRAGYRVRLVHPPGFDLDARVAARARELAGGRLERFDDLDQGVRGARVIYAKSWASPASYGRLEEEQRLRDRHRDWIIDERRQALGEPGAFMHCLPVRRNVVATDAVLDGPHSWVAEQARARVPVQAAVLHEVLG